MKLSLLCVVLLGLVATAFAVPAPEEEPADPAAVAAEEAGDLDGAETFFFKKFFYPRFHYRRHYAPRYYYHRSYPKYYWW